MISEVTKGMVMTCIRDLEKWRVREETAQFGYPRIYLYLLPYAVEDTSL
jgi:hypothetical protein